MTPAEILDACAAGRLPPPIALMHLIGATRSADDFAALVAQARATDAAPVQTLCALALRNPACWRLTHDMLATVAHDGSATIDQLATMFDDAVALSPAASVALYSMGDEAALDGATQDVIALMRAAGLIGQGRTMLDLGCGIGRFVRALAPEMRQVTGLDISRRMIDEARRRCAALGNVRLDVTDGRDLDGVADDSIDVVLAADVFPYLVQVDLALAAAHVREAARVLRNGGAMLILNFSYRGDAERDARDLRDMLAATSLRQAALPSVALAHWDASPFLLRKME
ncbi:MAG: Methyltransferase type 11 [Hyphomicrobiales bacterium]|nr:Methyltransferase type 11 [Hyphomicrobiales bacterium]